MEELCPSPQGKLRSLKLSPEPKKTESDSRFKIAFNGLVATLLSPVAILLGLSLTGLIYALTALNRYLGRQRKPVQPAASPPKVNFPRLLKYRLICKNCGQPSLFHVDTLMLKFKGIKDLDEFFDKVPCPHCHHANNPDTN